MPSYRKKPFAQLEHGTRIYAPSSGELQFRVVATDPSSGNRVFAKCHTEDLARAKAREFEQLILERSALPLPREDGPRTVDRLAASYVEEHLSGLSLNYREKHQYLLRRWILPQIGRLSVSSWTPVDSSRVIASVRRAGASDALVQDVGSGLRALVTHGRRLRWLTAQSPDPMWMVRYARRASIQGEAAIHIPRSSLPTDDECARLFEALENLGYGQWAIAMRLKHRAGVRWGELIALQADDIEFDPTRIVHVRRAVEQGTGRPASMKDPKNHKTRTTIFPKSASAELRALCAATVKRRGATGLLFPNATGGIMRRSNFQQIWVRAADAAGWPMTKPLRQSAGYGERNKGWKWTGAAKWTPHDLRHVAACWMLFDLGLDPAVVADKLGHADPSFTMKRYVGVRGDPDAAAMAITDSW